MIKRKRCWHIPSLGKMGSSSQAASFYVLATVIQSAELSSFFSFQRNENCYTCKSTIKYKWVLSQWQFKKKTKNPGGFKSIALKKKRERDCPNQSSNEDRVACSWSVTNWNQASSEGFAHRSVHSQVSAPVSSVSAHNLKVQPRAEDKKGRPLHVSSVWHLCESTEEPVGCTAQRERCYCEESTAPTKCSSSWKTLQHKEGTLQARPFVLCGCNRLNDGTSSVVFLRCLSWHPYLYSPLQGCLPPPSTRSCRGHC